MHESGSWAMLVAFQLSATLEDKSIGPSPEVDVAYAAPDVGSLTSPHAASTNIRCSVKTPSLHRPQGLSARVSVNSSVRTAVECKEVPPSLDDGSCDFADVGSFSVGFGRLVVSEHEAIQSEDTACVASSRAKQAAGLGPVACSHAEGVVEGPFENEGAEEPNLAACGLLASMNWTTNTATRIPTDDEKVAAEVHVVPGRAAS